MIQSSNPERFFKPLIDKGCLGRAQTAIQPAGNRCETGSLETAPTATHRGIDAPICQDSRSGSQVCGLARSVVCHHALKNLAGENAFETADDLPFGPPFSGASFDVVEGW